MGEKIDYYIDIEYEGDIDSFDCGFEVFNAYLKYKFFDVQEQFQRWLHTHV